MPRTTTTTSNNVQPVIHDSDGKNSPLPASAGAAVVSTGTPLSKNAVVHGQVAKTTVVINNPA
jgi:hypothetical protein